VIVEPTEEGMNVREFAKARKDMALGRLTDMQWDKCNAYQRGVLHHVDLAIKSITLDDLTELEEEYDPTRR
jgi:hypothetical protein